MLVFIYGDVLEVLPILDFLTVYVYDHSYTSLTLGGCNNPPSYLPHVIETL